MRDIRMKKVLAFLKGEMVLSIALIAALLSMLLVAPDAAYAGYVDWIRFARDFLLTGMLFSLSIVDLQI